MRNIVLTGFMGTGKTTVVRALADLLPEVEVVIGCRFGCNPNNHDFLRVDCRSTVESGKKLKSETRNMRVVNHPLSTTEDRLIGALDIERVKPLLYTPENRAYYGVGKHLGAAFSIGRQIRE